MYKHRLVTDTDPEAFDTRIKQELEAVDKDKLITVQFSTSAYTASDADGMQTVYSALIIYKS